MSIEPIKTEIMVLGAGPGGYTAAFYAADRGKKVTLVEQESRLGGVCLHHGCIPSKALLNATKLFHEVRLSERRGIHFGHPTIHLDQLRAWKDSVIEKLAAGLAELSRKRGVEVLEGRGHFEDSQTLRIETQAGQKFVQYEKAIIAVGSKAVIPHAFDLGNRRVMTSLEALQLEEIPADLLVIGGGYIGMELGTVYAALGSKVVVVETLDSILTEVDQDLVRPVKRAAEAAFKEIRVNTKVVKLATSGKKIKATLEAAEQKTEEVYDRVLVSVGRAPNYDDLGLENTKVTKDEKGFVKCDARQQTADPAIYAIGDVNGGALLAHCAAKEAKIAVEAILGESGPLEQIIVPAVVFTDPEVAWCGLTETEAKKRGIQASIARFPWSASGRALTCDRPDGLTKLVVEPHTDRILGVGLVGAGAGELIGEGVFAVEMGATARDLAESIHPHPTLSETLMECAEAFYGTSLHILGRKRSAG